ncbi:hypothetical protein P3T18_004353 [Paraburkholderia sp. GAS199]|uniref:hypothetical protein n=1 Tax=Paraburkholderia sp. GAS199 TaxID=3035126 RepID=UPI003D21E2B7
MKLIKPGLLACLLVSTLVSTLGYAQTSSQPAGQTASPSSSGQIDQAGKHHRFRTTNTDQDPDTCVGPVSFCTPFFGR